MAAEKLEPATVSLDSLVSSLKLIIDVATKALDVAADLEPFAPALTPVINDGLELANVLEAILNKI